MIKHDDLTKHRQCQVENNGAMATFRFVTCLKYRFLLWGVKALSTPALYEYTMQSPWCDFPVGLYNLL